MNGLRARFSILIGKFPGMGVHTFYITVKRVLIVCTSFMLYENSFKVLYEKVETRAFGDEKRFS